MKKKAPALQHVNQPLLQVLHPAQVQVEVCRAEELDRRRGLTAELDEMWSYVAKKSPPLWLGHAIDHHTGKVWAYVFGRRQDDVFLKLQQLLALFGITKFYTDGWGAYERHLVAEQHQVGKEHTQKIESKHSNLRTRINRLVRRTLCFSKPERMHDLVIGLFINRYEFGPPFCSGINTCETSSLLVTNLALWGEHTVWVCRGGGLNNYQCRRHVSMCRDIGMRRNHRSTPSSWCDRGAFYPVLRLGELPAA
jgi:insertion element IS1 protein InsB